MVFKRTPFLFYIAVCKEALEVHNYALTVDTFFFFLSQRNLLSLFFFLFIHSTLALHVSLACVKCVAQ